MAKMKMSEMNPQLTPEEECELAEAAARGPAFDEDCPEMTAEQLIQFRSVHRLKEQKQTVSLRLSPETLRKARAYGKGYTSFLSRLLDEAIDNDELVRKCI